MVEKRKVQHKPVLLQEVLKVLMPRSGKVYVDCTLGLGGHAAAVLERITPGGKLWAFDLDPRNIAVAEPKLQATGGAYEIFHANFAALQKKMIERGIGKLDGLLADLGVASPQLDDPTRGFSFKRNGPLDMRMNPTRGEPASALLARMSEAELATALRELGDEEDAEAIAALVVERRAYEPITTTHQLMAIVCAARRFTLERAAGAKLHPATRTFQALRILVNRELANLEALLRALPEVLKPGGVAAIISFHSGEDRRVKHSFREAQRAGIFRAVSNDAITAGAEEVATNPRARSAKLRWAQV